MVKTEKTYPPSDPGVANNYTIRHDPASFFDLIRFLEILVIHRISFISIFLVTFMLTVLYLISRPREYSATVEVFYNESIKEFVVESNVPVLKPEFDKTYWLSVMRSDEICRLIVKNSGLEYTPAGIKRLIAVDLKDKKEKRSTVFLLKITSEENSIIPTIIKAFVKSLNDILLKNQIQNSEKLISLLVDQLKESNAKIAEIDRELFGNGAVGKGAKRDLVQITTDIEKFRTELLNNQIEMASTIAAKEGARNELRNLDGTIVEDLGYGDPLKQQLVKLQLELAKALTRNREDHPTVKALRSNIQTLDRMLRDSLSRNVSLNGTLQNPVKSKLLTNIIEYQVREISLNARIASLNEVISEMEITLIPDSTDDRRQQLMRNRELVYITINLLNSKLIEAQSSSQSLLSRFVIIDNPEIPATASNKGILKLLSLGILIGFLLAAIVIYFYDRLDNRLMTISDYVKSFDIPMLGTVRHKKNPYEFCQGDLPIDGFGSELGDVMIQLRHTARHLDKKLLSVSSPLRGEGKSLISAMTAFMMAGKGMKVLLVDVDTFVPKLTKILKSTDKPGIFNFLESNIPISEIVQPTALPLLDFMGVGRSENPHPVLFDHPRFAEFLKYARENYDLVLFDTPALLYIPETTSLMEKIDGIVLVVRMESTPKQALEKLLKIIYMHDHKIIGTILNNVRLNSLGRYSDSYYYGKYGYGYGYGYQYSSGRKEQDDTERDS